MSLLDTFIIETNTNALSNITYSSYFMWCPSMCGFPNRYPNFVQRLEPTVSGCFITHLSPESFLRVQRRMIRWQIFQMQTFMSLKENFDFFSGVPLCSVYIKPDSKMLEPAVKMLQAGQEAISVAFGRFHQAVFAQNRRNPAENINPGAMVASGRDTHTLAFLSPHPSQSGM